MVTGLEAAITNAVAGSVTNQILQWAKGQGPDVSESEWRKAGFHVGNEVESIHELSKDDPSRRRDLRKELEISAKTYQKLATVGEVCEFDEDIVDRYSELATVCGEWGKMTKRHGRESEEVNRFTELHEECKDSFEN